MGFCIMWKVFVGVSCLFFVLFAPFWLTLCLVITTVTQFGFSESVPSDDQSDTSQAHQQDDEVDESKSGGSRFSEKLGQLEVAAEGWKARVTAPDSHQFSVAGKMGPVSTPQPALGGANRTPTPQVFTQSQGVASMSTPSVPDSLAALMKRSISVPEGKENEPSGDAPVVQVPEPCDEDFSSFFLSPDLERLANIDDVDLADLEHISSQTSHLSVVKRNVRVTRKHRSANPLKALAQRSDLRTEYVEVKSGVADREIRRMNIEKCKLII